jgi:hypothetical protein
MQSLSRIRSRRGGAVGGMSGMVQRGKPVVRGAQRQAPSSRALSSFVLNPASPAPELTAFSQEKRRQLAVLEASGMTASLRQGVEGRTRLASLRPAREQHPGKVAHRAHRVFTLHPARQGEVFIHWF